MAVSKLQTSLNMPEDKFTILSTRPLEQAVIIEAKIKDIEIDTISFIRTEPVKNSFLQKRIAEIVESPLTVIITSMNAAEAVAAYSQGLEPRWLIYCLGTATKKIVEQHFPESKIVGEADNASLLADEIIKNKEKKVIFFCGDQRRDDLPEKLTGYNILVEEIIVYNTIATPYKVDKDYDGILFFSSSAVKSFFSLNTITARTVLFAIGTTTAESIKQYSADKIIESDHPGKQSLVERAINYFGNLNHTNECIKK